jgi:hypothetical protein
MWMRVFRLVGLPMGMAGLLIVLYLHNPSTVHFYPPCLLYKCTGLYCPGCGALRATHQILHGHLGTAFHLNPLYVILLPWIAYMLVSRFLCELRGWRIPSAPVSPRLIALLPAIFIVYMVLRNLPYYPFTLLAPP